MDFLGHVFVLLPLLNILKNVKPLLGAPSLF